MGGRHTEVEICDSIKNIRLSLEESRKLLDRESISEIQSLSYLIDEFNVFKKQYNDRKMDLEEIRILNLVKEGYSYCYTIDGSVYDPHYRGGSEDYVYACSNECVHRNNLSKSSLSFKTRHDDYY